MTSMSNYPTTYHSRDAIAQKQHEMLDKQMETLNSFSNPTQQLEFIMVTFANFMGDSANLYLGLDAHDLNTVSEILVPNNTVVKNSYNDIVYNQTYDISEVDQAYAAINENLWILYTDPAFSDNTGLQDTYLNACTSLLGVQPTSEDYTITVDGSQESVPVPQFEPDQIDTDYNNMPNDEATTQFWSGWDWDNPGPSSAFYQNYLNEQSEWNSDLMIMSDSCNQVTAQMQAQIQQNENMQQSLYGEWNDMIQQNSKSKKQQVNAETKS